MKSPMRITAEQARLAREFARAPEGGSKASQTELAGLLFDLYQHFVFNSELTYQLRSCGVRISNRITGDFPPPDSNDIASILMAIKPSSKKEEIKKIHFEFILYSIMDNLYYQDYFSKNSKVRKRFKESISKFFTDENGTTPNNDDQFLEPDNDKDYKSEDFLFQGALTRDFMAQALNAVMVKEGLSERTAARVSGTSKTDIARIKSGQASIEKAAEVLTALGYPPKATLSID